MPKKIRELKAILKKAGFTQLKKRGKGSHSVWRHPLLTDDINLAGKDGNDAKPYQEKEVLDALEELKLIEERENEK